MIDMFLYEERHCLPGYNIRTWTFIHKGFTSMAGLVNVLNSQLVWNMSRKAPTQFDDNIKL